MMKFKSGFPYIKMKLDYLLPVAGFWAVPNVSAYYIQKKWLLPNMLCTHLTSLNITEPLTIHAHCWRCRSCGGGPLAANTRHRVFRLAKTKPTKPALGCRWMDGCGPYVAGSNKPLLLGSSPSPTTGNQREFGPQWYIYIYASIMTRNFYNIT